MHLRRWPRLTVPSTIIQMVRVVAEADRAGEAAALAVLPDGGELFPSDNPRHMSGRLAPDIAFTFERHSEASTITLFIARPDAALVLDPNSDARLRRALDWTDTLPGGVIRATCIGLVEDERIAADLVEQVGFVSSDLLTCHIGNGPRIWSDFRIRADGFGCLLIAANGVVGSDLSRLVHRLQELGNYRNLALLGLPVAQGCWGKLNRIETELHQLARDVARPEIADDALLERVSTLSLELMSIATGASYRMSATAAYAELVDERLDELAITPITGFPSLTDFTQRRLLPAVRTCAAHVRREADLSARAAQFAALLRTRVETRIESQNGQLLRSMERSASTQLRLQQLVEGLSVVALSYYCIGLLSYMFKGLEGVAPNFPDHMVTAVLVPIIVIAMWAGLQRMKRRLLK